MHLKNQAGEAGGGAEQHLGELQLGLFLHQQQHAQGQHRLVGVCGTHKFQLNGLPAADAQGQAIAGTGVVEGHGPVVLGAHRRQGVAKGLAQLIGVQGLQAWRQGDTIKGIAAAIEPEARDPGGRRGQSDRNRRGGGIPAGSEGRQRPQIGEPPILLVPAGQGQGLQGGAAPALHIRQGATGGRQLP